MGLFGFAWFVWVCLSLFGFLFGFVWRQEAKIAGLGVLERFLEFV